MMEAHSPFIIRSDGVFTCLRTARIYTGVKQNYSFSLTSVILQVVPHFQGLQISLHAVGGLPRRRAVDAAARQVCDCVCVSVCLCFWL